MGTVIVNDFIVRRVESFRMEGGRIEDDQRKH